MTYGSGLMHLMCYLKYILIAKFKNIKMLNNNNNAEAFTSNPNEMKANDLFESSAFLFTVVIWICHESLWHPSTGPTLLQRYSCQLCADWPQQDHLSFHAIANYEQIRATVNFLMCLLVKKIM